LLTVAASTRSASVENNPRTRSVLSASSVRSSSAVIASVTALSVVRIDRRIGRPCSV
jgi:hypothetical protein